MKSHRGGAARGGVRKGPRAGAAARAHTDAAAGPQAEESNGSGGLSAGAPIDGAGAPAQERPRTLSAHYGRVCGANKKIPSQCPICKKTFVGLYELRRHFGRKHNDGNKVRPTMLTSPPSAPPPRFARSAGA